VVRTPDPQHLLPPPAGGETIAARGGEENGTTQTLLAGYGQAFSASKQVGWVYAALHGPEPSCGVGATVTGMVSSFYPSPAFLSPSSGCDSSHARGYPLLYLAHLLVLHPQELLVLDSSGSLVHSC
jgi:hypothetical protein